MWSSKNQQSHLFPSNDYQLYLDPTYNVSCFTICDYFYRQYVLIDASCLSESLRFESSNGFVQDQGTLPELSVTIVSTLILPL